MPAREPARSPRKCLHRRRRRVHRQSLRRFPARRRRAQRVSRSTTTSRRGGSGTTPHHVDDPRFRVVRGDVDDLDRRSRDAMAGHDLVIHLASNPDIARAMTEPTIDFDQGTLRSPRGRRGDAHDRASRGIALRVGQRRLRRPGRDARPTEDHGPLIPVSTYGASKLAGEALIAPTPTCSGCRAARSASATWSGRARPTASASTSSAGCCAEPTGRELTDPRRRHPVEVLHPGQRRGRGVLGRTRRRHRLPFRSLQRRDRRLHHRPRDRRTGRGVRGLAEERVGYEFTGGDRGWKGDVPVVRLNTARIAGSAGAASTPRARRCAARCWR